MLQYANHVLSHITFTEWIGFFLVAIVIAVWDKLWNAIVYAVGHGTPVSFYPTNKVLAIYVAFILLVTLFSREIGGGGEIAWMPLWSWQKVLMGHNLKLLWQILLNVLLFVPVGVLLALNRNRSTKALVLIGFGLSLCIELCQLVFRLGLFEWDDILHNGGGSALGVLAVRTWQNFLQKVKKR